MKKTVTSAEVVENWETLVNDIAHDGDEVVITVDGVPILKLVAFEAERDKRPPTEQSESSGLVLYNGRWMIPAAADRERDIEHLRGSGKILGDIVSPIDDVEWDTYE